MYGCDHWEYGYGRASLGFSEKAKDPTTGLNDQSANCKFPERWGWIAAFYMVSFVVLGALVLLTLFIGIVATAMEEAKAGQQDDDAKEELLVARALRAAEPRRPNLPRQPLRVGACGKEVKQTFTVKKKGRKCTCFRNNVSAALAVSSVHLFFIVFFVFLFFSFFFWFKISVSFIPRRGTRGPRATGGS